jgi:hypothetical protein
MFILNTTTIFVDSLDIWGGIEDPTPYNTSQLEESLNGTEQAQNWDPPESGGLFGDVKAGLQALDRFRSFIYAFPNILANVGVPDQLIILFNNIWTVFWFISIVDLIMGGKIFGT